MLKESLVECNRAVLSRWARRGEVMYSEGILSHMGLGPSGRGSYREGLLPGQSV
jgi:hypothetical protein